MALVLPDQRVGIGWRGCGVGGEKKASVSASRMPLCLRRRKRYGLRSLQIKAVGAKTEIDFSDPNWKFKFQEEFEERFSLPHMKDVLDVNPRPTTFSLKNRGQKIWEGIGDADERNDYVNNDDRALLKVHGAFAGFSGITVGICNTHYVYLPIPEVIAETRQIDPNSRMWHRCLISTGQPDFM